MENSCPVLTPEERQYLDIQDRAQAAMLTAIGKAIDDAAAQAAEEFHAAGLKEPPPVRDYFAAVAHQQLFILLCGGDPETFAGGDPNIAARILENGRNISSHYWAGSKDTTSP